MRADVNSCDTGGRTPLHIASSNGHEQGVALLIRYHANVDALCHGGATPLHCAVQWGQLTTSCTLLAAGAQHDKRTCFGQTPLDYTCYSKSEPIRNLAHILHNTDPQEFLEISRKLYILLTTTTDLIHEARSRAYLSMGTLAHAAIDRLGENSPARVIDTHVHRLIFKFLKQAEENDARQEAIARVTQKEELFSAQMLQEIKLHHFLRGRCYNTLDAMVR